MTNQTRLKLISWCQDAISALEKESTLEESDPNKASLQDIGASPAKSRFSPMDEAAYEKGKKLGGPVAPSPAKQKNPPNNANLKDQSFPIPSFPEPSAQRLFMRRFIDAVVEIFKSVTPIPDYKSDYNFERGRFAAYVKLADAFENAIVASEAMLPSGVDFDIFSYRQTLGLADKRDFALGTAFVDGGLELDEDLADLKQAIESSRSAKAISDFWGENLTHANLTHAKTPEQVSALFSRISVHLERVQASLKNIYGER